MAINQELLDILACPKCKGEIHLNEKKTAWFVKPVDWCTRYAMTFPLC